MKSGRQERDEAVTSATQQQHSATEPTDRLVKASGKGNGAGRRLRVCHISMCLTTGGLERLLVEFARRTNPLEFEVQFVALGELGGPAEEIRELDCPVAAFSRETHGSRWRQISALARHLRNTEVDLVHTHNTFAHFYGTLAARLAGIRAIMNTQHGRGCGDHWKQRWHFRLANRLSRRVLAVSEDSVRMCRQQDRWGRRYIHTLWNGIDLNRFAYRGPAREPHAISVARLSPEKDFPTLIQAIPYVLPEHPEFRLSIVGEGKERPLLEQLIRQLELTDRVRLLGERRDVPELLEQAALFVSSSSTEGISLTLLEAMAVGLPIVATAVGGNPEVVQDGATGYLVPAGDPKSLAHAINRHLSQRDTWKPMSQLARQRVETQFNIERMIYEYEDIYRDLSSN